MNVKKTQNDNALVGLGEKLTEETYVTRFDWPLRSALVSALCSSRPCVRIFVSLRGLEELETASMARAKAPKVVFLFGGAQPRI